MRTVPGDQPVIQQFRQWFEIFGVRGIIADEQVQRCDVACPVLMPQPHGIHPVELMEIGFPGDVQLAFDEFESTLQSHTSEL